MWWPFYILSIIRLATAEAENPAKQRNVWPILAQAKMETANGIIGK
jgi:hypothetical protein